MANENKPAAPTIGTEPAFDEWWEVWRVSEDGFTGAWSKHTAHAAWNAALAKAPQAAAPDPMEEFLSVCEGSCDHPYCWSQKGQNGGNNEKALVQDVPLERGISAARGVLRDVGNRVQEVRTDLVGDRLAAPTIGTEPTHEWLGCEEVNDWFVASCSCGWTYQHPNYGTTQDTFVNHWADHSQAEMNRQLASAIAERDKAVEQIHRVLRLLAGTPWALPLREAKMVHSAIAILEE